MSWWVKHRGADGKGELWSINTDPMLIIGVVGLIAVLYVPRIIANGAAALRFDGILLLTLGIAIQALARVRHQLGIAHQVRRWSCVLMLFGVFLILGSVLGPLVVEVPDSVLNRRRR